MLPHRRIRSSALAPSFTAVALLWLPACGGDQFEAEGGTGGTSGEVQATPSSSTAGGTSSNPAPSSGLAPSFNPAPPNVPPPVPVSSDEATDFPSDSTAAAGSSPVVDTLTQPAPSSSPQSSSDIEASPSSDSTNTEVSGDVPATEHCAATADWDPAWAQWEEEVLVLVNEYRAAGANCDSEGEFGPAEPLAMDSLLRCSSRLHSKDMYDRDFFDHTNLDGLDPFDRMEEAGFSGSYMGENIAYGQPSPEEVMADWMESDGHCSNIMNPNFTLLGVGYYPGSDDWREGQHFWTQNFGTPLMQGGGGGFGGGGGGFGAQ